MITRSSYDGDICFDFTIELHDCRKSGHLINFLTICSTLHSGEDNQDWW